MRIALAYLILATAWILGSDTLAERFFQGPYLFELGIAKGMFYVAVTAALLYWATRSALQRQQTQHALISSLWEATADGVIFTDGELQIASINAEACQLLHYESHELLGQSMLSLVPQRNWPWMHASLEAARTDPSGEFSLRGEYSALRKDGTEFPITSTMSLRKTGAGFVIMFVFQDISAQLEEQTRLEAELSLARREAELASCLAGPLDEQRCCEAVCSFITDAMGFPLAWAARSLDKDLELLLLARSGPASSFVDTARLCSVDSVLGRGPAGHALRERGTVVTEDLASAENYGPWRQSALEAGLRSKVSIPLLSGEQALGVLNIYRSQAGPFEGSVLLRLEALAGTLASRIQRSRAEDDLRKELLEVERQRQTLQQREHELQRQFVERLTAEDELQMRDRQLSSFLSGLEVPACVALDGTVRFANPAFEALCRRSRAELIGKSIETFTAPEDREEVMQRHLNRMAGLPAEHSYVMTVLRPDGERRQVHASAGMLHFGGQTCVLWLGSDLTELLAAKERQRSEEENFRRLLAELNLPIAVVQDLRLSYLNQAYCSLLGYSADELIGEAVDKVLSPSVREEVIRHYTNQLAGLPAPDSYLTLLRHKDGHDTSVSRSVVVSQFNNKPAVLLADTDISALTMAEQRLRSALESVGDTVWDWNPQTNEAYFSDSWKQMLGYPEDAALNHFADWESRVHPEDLPGALEVLRIHFAGQSPLIQYKMRLHHRDGSWRWILARGKVLEWAAAGLPLRVVGTHIDITEQEELQRSQSASVALFKLLTDYSTDIISRTDRSGTIVYISPACQRLTGFSPQELQGRSAYELIHPQDVANMAALQGLAPGSTLLLRYRMRRKDGVYVNTESGVHVLEDGAVNVSRIIGRSALREPDLVVTHSS